MAYNGSHPYADFTGKAERFMFSTKFIACKICVKGAVTCWCG